MTTPREVIDAALVWTGDRFEAGPRIEVRDGLIASVGPSDAPTTRPFPHHALLPGFVNAHSHAFQRALRGSGERFASGAGSFWTWRAAMYDLVQTLDTRELGRISRLAFAEMLTAGITTVGEFHYLHHDRDHDFAFDDVVMEAAAAVGIRLVLLNAFYRTGGFGRPLEPGQARFATPSTEVYWEQVDRLAGRLRPDQSLGVVAHSLRAVPRDDLGALYREARDRGYEFHLHLEEQRREVEECRAAYGQTPMAVLLETVGSAEHVTAVHCTHSQPDDLHRFLDAGGRTCVCPLTEANLGDGIPPLANFRIDPDRLCLGTDSNARIGMLEEMRWLEYGQRLREERRGILIDEDGDVGARMIASATRSGADALGIRTGRIAPGYCADFVAVDLRSPDLVNTPPERLPAALVTGAGNRAVADVCVAGRWRSDRPATPDAPT